MKNKIKAKIKRIKKLYEDLGNTQIKIAFQSVGVSVAVIILCDSKNINLDSTTSITGSS